MPVSARAHHKSLEMSSSSSSSSNGFDGFVDERESRQKKCKRANRANCVPNMFFSQSSIVALPPRAPRPSMWHVALDATDRTMGTKGASGKKKHDGTEAAEHAISESCKRQKSLTGVFRVSASAAFPALNGHGRRLRRPCSR